MITGAVLRTSFIIKTGLLLLLKIINEDPRSSTATLNTSLAKAVMLNIFIYTFLITKQFTKMLV